MVSIVLSSFFLARLIKSQRYSYLTLVDPPSIRLQHLVVEIHPGELQLCYLLLLLEIIR